MARALCHEYPKDDAIPKVGAGGVVQLDLLHGVVSDENAVWLLRALCVRSVCEGSGGCDVGGRESVELVDMDLRSGRREDSHHEDGEDVEEVHAGGFVGGLVSVDGLRLHCRYSVRRCGAALEML